MKYRKRRRNSCEHITDTLKTNLHKHQQVRSQFAYMGRECVTSKLFITSDYYNEKGLRVDLRFSSPITEERRLRHNELGHWINQSYIVRLHAVLEYHRFTGIWKIKENTVGWEEVDIVRRLRNIFVHTIGDYDSTNEDHKRLRDSIITRFDTKPLETEKEDFTLNIGAFLEPVTLKCVEHVEANYDAKPKPFKSEI